MEVRNETLAKHCGSLIGTVDAWSTSYCFDPHSWRITEGRKTGISDLPIANQNANTATLPATSDADAPTYTPSNIDQAAGAAYQNTNTHIYPRSANTYP